MRFRDDDRAVTVQIGAVLLFATLIIALSLYQATVVPSQNADVEYKHSQTTQDQLTDVRNGLLRSAATGNSQPASVSLGTQYPSRVFLMNPPPATGTLRTGSYDNSTIRVSNVEATNPETRDFLNSSWNASTKYLEYEPDYNEFDNAPNLRYESSVLSNYYPNADGGTAIPLTDQLLVDNETRTITLVTLNGSLSTSRADSVSVTPETLSAPYQRVQVQPATAGDPVNVSVPTRLPAGQLENRTDLGSHPGVIDVANVPDENRVVIKVEWSDRFTFQTARVGVGSQTENPPPHYLTLVENRGDRVTVEARDRFNNAESGVTVSVNGSNSFYESSKQTDESGRATFEVEQQGTNDATLEILNGSEAHERVEVTVRRTGPGGGSGGGGGDGGGDGGESATFDSKIVDQGQAGSLARYEASYDATSVPNFDHVEVTYGNVDNTWANETYTSTDPRNNIDDYGWADENGGTGGNEYQITIEVYNDSGVVDSRTATDIADGTNPSGNNDLSEADSPTLDSTTLRDQNPNSVEYELDYEISNPAEKFTEAEVLFLNTDSHQATGEETGTALSDTVSYSGYSIDDEYEVYVQVQDDDGIVVDQEIITDTADGET